MQSLYGEGRKSAGGSLGCRRRAMHYGVTTGDGVAFT